MRSATKGLKAQKGVTRSAYEALNILRSREILSFAGKFLLSRFSLVALIFAMLGILPKIDFNPNVAKAGG
jgi:hypothetical protein